MWDLGVANRGFDVPTRFTFPYDAPRILPANFSIATEGTVTYDSRSDMSVSAGIRSALQRLELEAGQTYLLGRLTGATWARLTGGLWGVVGGRPAYVGLSQVKGTAAGCTRISKYHASNGTRKTRATACRMSMQWISRLKISWWSVGERFFVFGGGPR